MLPLTLLTLAAAATASPLSSSFSNQELPRGIASRSISSDDMHFNVMKRMPEDRIITSETLHHFLATREDKSGLAYVKDTRSFVDLSSVKPVDSKRQFPFPIPCSGFTQYQAINAKKEWGPWNPISNCLWNEKSSGELSENINWSQSIAVTGSFSMDFGLIEDVLSASVGITVTSTHTEGGSHGCTVPGGDVGQIWGQVIVGKADIQQRDCHSCPDTAGPNGCEDWRDAGSAEAPSESNDDATQSCSTGRENVNCDFRLE